jgi:hypothetical protein
MGAGFIWWFFPETKGLSLEEMDVVFGSHGFAAADAERMREINREIGLEQVAANEPLPGFVDEKTGTQHKEADSDSF